MSEPDTVTARQASAITGLSERTIRRRILAGTLKATQVAPNRYAIDRRDLPPRRKDSYRAILEELRAGQDTLYRMIVDLEALIMSKWPQDAPGSESDVAQPWDGKSYPRRGSSGPVSRPGGPVTAQSVPSKRRAAAWVAGHSGLSDSFVLRWWPAGLTYAELWTKTAASRKGSPRPCGVGGCPCESLASS